jgi:hypothetical protein
MDAPRGTPEEIAAATRECIEANEASMACYEKKMKLLEELPVTDATRKEYKNAFDSYHRLRIATLQLKGEIPEHKPRKAKSSFGMRTGNC